MAIEYRTEPGYIEYLDGRGHPKVSPRFPHPVIQGRMLRVLERCAGDRGFVGTEWDAVVVRGADGKETKLIPDVSFVSFPRLRALNARLAEQPPFAPDVAVEVRSPGDRIGYLRRKIDRYLACGSLLVLDVVPRTRTIVAHTADETRTYAGDATFEHPAVPWLRFDLDEIFGGLEIAR